MYPNSLPQTKNYINYINPTSEYVRVHRENIIPSRYYNFGKILREYRDLSSPYDTFSVMHYDSYGFTNGRGPTITSVRNGRDSGKRFRAQRSGVSSMDVYEICKMYGCQKCAGQSITSYKGEGKCDKNENFGNNEFLIYSIIITQQSL